MIVSNGFTQDLQNLQLEDIANDSPAFHKELIHIKAVQYCYTQVINIHPQCHLMKKPILKSN